MKNPGTEQIPCPDWRNELAALGYFDGAWYAGAEGAGATGGQQEATANTAAAATRAILMYFMIL